jgi:hypothetical protein
MDRIFLAMIVSGLMLATTSTTLLVASSGEPLAVSAINRSVSARIAEGRLKPGRIEQTSAALPEGGRSERTRF